MLSLKLLPGSKFILLHIKLQSKIINYINEDSGSQIGANIEETLKELYNFSKRLDKAECTINGVKNFIKSEKLEIAKYFPHEYYIKGHDGDDDGANELFFYFQKQDPRGYWVCAIFLFFPHLFLERSFGDKLESCSCRDKFEAAADARFCEAYKIYYKNRTI